MAACKRATLSASSAKYNPKSRRAALLPEFSRYQRDRCCQCQTRIRLGVIGERCSRTPTTTWMKRVKHSNGGAELRVQEQDKCVATRLTDDARRYKVRRAAAPKSGNTVTDTTTGTTTRMRRRTERLVGAMPRLRVTLAGGLVIRLVRR